jgi:type 1 fimbria pilin
MSNLKKAITGFFFATVFLVFMGIHISADMSEISFTGESVCAQTGTCEWSVMDNCYVNGEKDPYRK